MDRSPAHLSSTGAFVDRGPATTRRFRPSEPEERRTRRRSQEVQSVCLPHRFWGFLEFPLSHEDGYRPDPGSWWHRMGTNRKEIE